MLLFFAYSRSPIFNAFNFCLFKWSKKYTHVINAFNFCLFKESNRYLVCQMLMHGKLAVSQITCSNAHMRYACFYMRTSIPRYAHTSSTALVSQTIFIIVQKERQQSAQLVTITDSAEYASYKIEANRTTYFQTLRHKPAS
jgi:hypothetical protein